MPGAQLFHLHIPKTAGSSLRSAFVHGNRLVLPVNSNFVYDSRQHAEIDLFTGHAGYRAIEASPDLKRRVVTLLRDPLDRIVSYYYHLAESFRAGVEITPRTDLANKYSLREFLAIRDHPHLISDMHNAMTWQIIHDASIDARMSFRGSRPALGDAELVALAKDNLSSFKVVGFQHRMGDFAESVSRASGFPVNPGFDNVNKARAALDSLDAETRRRLREWIEMDVAVYEWALSAYSTV